MSTPNSFIATRRAPKSFGRLDPAFQRLVVLMQSMHFGRVEGLFVCRGDPIYTPPPRVLRTHKLGAATVPLAVKPDFVLKRQVVELIERIESLGDGRVERIDVAHGLPLKVLIEDPSFEA